MNDYSTPPGWYPDGAGWERRWDGSAWTDERRRSQQPESPAPRTPPSGTASGWPGSAPQSSQSPQSPQSPQDPGSAPTQARPAFAPPTSAPPSTPPSGAGSQQPAGSSGWPAAPTGYGQVPSQPGSSAQPGYHPPPGAYPPPGSFPPPGGTPRAGGTGPGGGRLGLWVALGVVLLLLVGGGITVAVIQPWDDGQTTATDGEGDGDGEGEGRAGATGVTGDADGDGLGDVTLALDDDIEDRVQLVTGTSTGEAFEVTELAGDPVSSPTALSADIDGDGVEEQLTATYRAEKGELVLASPDSDFAVDEPIALDFRSLAESYPAEARVSPGDFNGDGALDLAILGPVDRTVEIHVMLGEGDGSYAAPARWASVPNTLLSTTLVQAGDFDGDGDDDLFAELPTEKLKAEDYDNGYFFGDDGIALLTSDGSGFDVGDPVENDEYLNAYLVADLGGDKDLVLTVVADSYDEELTLVANEFLDGRLLPDPGFRLVDPIGDRDLLAATASDVDGDGDDDVVYVVKESGKKKVGDLSVVLTGDGEFAAGEAWGSVPACGYEYCNGRFY